MKVEIGEFRLKLYPRNFVLVRSFYEKRLGFEVVNEWDRGDNDKGVMFRVGNATLELLSPENGYQPIAGCDLSLEVSNVEELWNEMKDTENVLHSLRHNSWGDTSFRIADPEGFAISFFTKDKSNKL